MHLSLYLAIMLTLSTIIALLSLLLMVLERRPQGRHAAARQALELDQLSPGRRESDEPQRAIRSRRGESRQRRLDDARHGKTILSGLSLNNGAEDERDQDREVSQDWKPAAAASGPTSG